MNYYITIITLSILFFQYHALENNVENDDNALLNFIQNDLFLKNSINQDSMIHSISENKYLKKRQADGKGGQKKSVVKKTSKPKVPLKKPLKPTASKPSTKKPVVKPQALRKTTSKTTRRTTSTRRPPTTTHKRSTGKPTRSTTRTAPKTTSKGPVVPPKKPAPITSMSKKTSRPSTTTKTSTTTKSSRTTKSPATTKSSITTKPSTTSTSTSTSKPTPKINLEPNADKKLEIIKEINDVRKVHKAQELKVDQELSDEAQRLTTHAIQHSQDVRYDGNDGLLIYYYEQGQHDNPIDVWLAGYTEFNFQDPENNTPDYSNFTQLLWADSKKIGCGISKYTVYDVTVFACLVSPKGNIPGHYKENVHYHV